MAIRAITNGLDHKIRNDENFHLVFNIVVIPELCKLLASTTIDDYCIFIDIQPVDDGTKVVFHDGGSTYDEKSDAMKYTYYKTMNTDIPLSLKETLYYSIDEQVICFLDER